MPDSMGTVFIIGKASHSPCQRAANFLYVPTTQGRSSATVIRPSLSMADYHKLAGMMAHHEELAIFRRFDTLNLKNLLYMQAELIHLEAELRQMELDEKISADPNKPVHPMSVYDLREVTCTGKTTQWAKYQEVQGKLQAYSGSYESLS